MHSTAFWFLKVEGSTPGVSIAWLCGTENSRMQGLEILHDLEHPFPEYACVLCQKTHTPVIEVIGRNYSFVS